MGAKKPRVAIIGAGISGLAAARRLHVCAGDLIDLVVFEAGDHIGGRIFTSEFAGAKIEMGATWIHGIDGNPVYDIARKAGALIPDDHGNQSLLPWECMDGFPSNPLTLAEGGHAVAPSVLQRTSDLFSDLKDLIASGETSAGVPSVGAFLRRGFTSYRASQREIAWDWTEEAAFSMLEFAERTCTAVDDLESLDLASEKEYLGFPGEHITLPGGYSRIPEFLAAALPSSAIRLCRVVSLVEWRRSASRGDQVKIHFEDGAVEPADHAIVTVSLGVLKAGLNFSPALPDAKRDAIDRLGFGLVTKLFMELEKDDESKIPFPFLRIAFDPGRRISSIPDWMRRTDSICPIHGGSRVLLAWFVGSEAAEVEKLDEEEIIRGIHATLAGVAGVAGGRKFGRIAAVRRSGWGRDPRFLGSYSYVAVGSRGNDQDELAAPLPLDGHPAPLQILFAGEATHRTRYATTHGAYMSGVREADRLLRHYGYLACRS